MFPGLGDPNDRRYSKLVVCGDKPNETLVLSFTDNYDAIEVISRSNDGKQSKRLNSIPFRKSLKAVLGTEEGFLVIEVEGKEGLKYFNARTAKRIEKSSFKEIYRYAFTPRGFDTMTMMR